MSLTRPYILSIAGFDPSAGAGVLADVKTFEGIGVYGLAVSTATTIQTDLAFLDCDWENISVVKKQVETLLARFTFDVIKIGIVPSLAYLNELLEFILANIPQAKIVWDPVYQSSTGYQFIEQEWNDKTLQAILQKVYLITPNANEACVFGKYESAVAAAKSLAKFCAVLLKGGHAEGVQSTDVLYLNSNEFHFTNERLNGFSKHGSGCVLSSAIAAYLAKGEDLEVACSSGKKYIHSYLQSSNSLLGYHVSVE